MRDLYKKIIITHYRDDKILSRQDLLSAKSFNINSLKSLTVDSQFNFWAIRALKLNKFR